MTTDKIAILAQQPQKLFHTSDLKILWNISNQNTLHKSIARLIKRGVIFRIQKGFYSIVPIDQLDPIEIGFRAIKSFSYLSTESVLADNGLINQIPSKITFISQKSANFIINNTYYSVRQLKASSLHNPIGIKQNNLGIFVATIERAVADMLYFQPKYHFDNDGKIDWTLVKNYQTQLGYL
jgi:predicted transcriptional regulator of viral defense system